MNMPSSVVLAILMTLLLAGCQTGGSKGQGLTRNPGDSFLQEGIEDYE